MQYRDFPKGDARRYFVVLMAVDRLKAGATLHYVSQEIGSTRAEVQRALEAVVEQFGVELERNESAYRITSWGVLKKAVVADLTEV